ncbi:MAG: benzoyl-CoA-dihydrodiol lyase [Candidatus Eisenbacteria bacterium]|nr:benzoyl-CoA-dihydrodiol lyase [Candidatus Eisenbacteria bacterium]
MERILFETEPSRYKHWQLSFEGSVATLRMNVQEDQPLHPGYVLKLNSYDLGVDIELADAIQRIRFEHPEVKALLVESAKDRIFCSGANIFMLGSSSHGFKVNFCKYTNETRLYLEELVDELGVRTLCAVNGICAGGGYELALACEKIFLVDDGNAAVSLPETPLLGVLPGTGGLTRVVDKRKVRRDLADVFSTVAEGIRGDRAAKWNLVDEVHPRSKFDASVKSAVESLAAEASRNDSGAPMAIEPLGGNYTDDAIEHRYVRVEIDHEQRVATLVMQGPPDGEPLDASGMRAKGKDLWAWRAFRELDDALLHLRFNFPEVGLLLVKTEGDADRVRAIDGALLAARDEDFFVREVVFHMGRVLRRYDITARSLFAVIEPGSCFAGSLLELALAADRSYMLDDPDQPVAIALSAMNFASEGASAEGASAEGASAGDGESGAFRGFLTWQGLTRLETRFFGDPERAEELRGQVGESFDPEGAEEAGLVTFIPDDIDWEDEIRIAIEERVSLSPDALTGMEANLRCPGPETMATKIFGRLSAWQNWIFTRPNSTGEKGALTLYGKPARAEFDWKRT